MYETALKVIKDSMDATSVSMDLMKILGTKAMVERMQANQCSPSKFDQEFTRAWDRWNQLKHMGALVSSMKRLKQADLKFSLVTVEAATSLIDEGKVTKENPIFLELHFRSDTVRFLWVGVHYVKGCMLISREELFDQMFESTTNFQSMDGLLGILLYIHEQDKIHTDANAPFIVQSGCRYTNIKTGNIYEVLYLAKHSETQEPVVVYRGQYPKHNEVWVRPLGLFQEKFVEFFDDGGEKGATPLRRVDNR